MTVSGCFDEYNEAGSWLLHITRARGSTADKISWPPFTYNLIWSTSSGPNCCGYDEFLAKMMIETLMTALVITENCLVSMIQSFINNCVWVLMPFVFLLLVVEDNLEYLHALKDVRAVTIQDSI